VVSVSMLTEGWDANTVTHVLGVRAFGTQLLCEQVVGRALRRRSYATASEREVLRSNLERYHRYNEVLHSAGLAQDQKARIETLAKAVDDLPAQEKILGPFSAAGPASLVLMGALVVATGVLGWVAAERGRRLASLERPGGRPVAVRAAKVRRADVDSKAV